MRKALLLFISTLFMFQTAIADEVQDEPMAISVKRLSLDTTIKIAKGAIDACRQKGIPISVTVVDRNGLVQIVMRDTVAATVSLEISRQKAYTAANFGVATSQLTGTAATPIGRVDGLVMSAGGIPIQAAGHILGAIGVSGAPSGVTDEECAQVGIETVMDDLEMDL
ncbi:MAG: heme-binding protein [Gammaproteobacteria bacterium]|nr:heme-binding protein [Gammaproteobacteria bacterium]